MLKSTYNSNCKFVEPPGLQAPSFEACWGVAEFSTSFGLEVMPPNLSTICMVCNNRTKYQMHN